MKKSLIILLTVALLSVLFLSSCNVDASDGLADQVRNSAQASGIRILQLLYIDSSENIYVRSDKGIYEISDGNETAKYISDDIKAAYYDGATYVYYLTQAGKLYKYTLSDPSDNAVFDSSREYSYLDENGFLLGNDKHIYRIESGSVVSKDTTHSFSSLLSSGSSYLGKVSGENKYYYNGTEVSTSLTFTAIVEYDDTNHYSFVAANDKKVYRLTDSLSSSAVATLSNVPTGVACMYTDASGTYAVFKAGSSFEYLSSTDNFTTVSATSLTTKWASSLRSLSLAGCDSADNNLYIATIGNGIWKVTAINDSEAEQIFY